MGDVMIFEAPPVAYVLGDGTGWVPGERTPEARCKPPILGRGYVCGRAARWYNIQGDPLMKPAGWGSRNGQCGTVYRGAELGCWSGLEVYPFDAPCGTAGPMGEVAA